MRLNNFVNNAAIDSFRHTPYVKKQDIERERINVNFRAERNCTVHGCTQLLPLVI